MRKYLDRIYKWTLAGLLLVVVNATTAAAATSITIINQPSGTLKNGEWTNVSARVTSDVQLDQVWVRYRYTDPHGTSVSAKTWVNNFLAMSTTNGVDFTGFLPIVPGGTLEWRVQARDIDGKYEATPTSTLTIEGTLGYDRFHDMKRFLRAGLNNNFYDEKNGWVWDNGTNFTAQTPNGGEWYATGMGWAATRTSRFPQGDGLGAVALADNLADSDKEFKFPVLFFCNFNPEESESYIRTPKFSEGIGTYSFNTKQKENINSLLSVQISRKDNPGDGDWIEVATHALTDTSSVAVTNIINDGQAKYLRVVKKSYNAGYNWNDAYISIDNLCVTPPVADIVMREKLRNPGYPNANEDITIRCMVSNVIEHIPALNRVVKAHYALGGTEFESIAPSRFAVTNMTYIRDVNGYSLFEGKIPAQKDAGWLHYFFECEFDGYYYTTPEENGLPSPKYLSGTGCTTDAPTSAASTHLTTEVRASKSRYSKVNVVQIIDGGASVVTNAMTLVDDNQWQISMAVKEGMTTEAYFVGEDCYTEDAESFLTGYPFIYGDRDQDEPYDTPTGGTPERQMANTNNLPGIIINVDSDGYMVYRFDDADDEKALNYTIRRGVFQDFNDWEDDGVYYVESLYGAGVGKQEENFSSWVEPYGWLPEDNARENFELCASNSLYTVYGDILPSEDEFNANNTTTPHGWYMKDFRLVNERTTNNVARFEYGGSSNVVAQIRSGGSIFNTDNSLPQGAGNVETRMRTGITDGAVALYKDQTWGYGNTAQSLLINTSFSIPPLDRSNSRYYASVVFDYKDQNNYHELRFVRSDSTDANDNRLRLQLAEVANGVEKVATHSTVYANNNVKSETIYELNAAISYSGTTITVKLTSMKAGNGNIGGWNGGQIALSGCTFTGGSQPGYVGVGAYECAPKFNYIVISGGTSSTSYAGGSDASVTGGKASVRFSTTESSWFLGGTDDTAPNVMDNKWYFDESLGYVLRRRIPAMTVNLKIDSAWWGLMVEMSYTVESLQYVTQTLPFHAWDPFYVEYSVGRKGSGNCVVFDSTTITPWRGGTRGPLAHDYTPSFDWTAQSQQNALARQAAYRDKWLIFEGWAVTNNISTSEKKIDGVAARFQYSQANSNLVQALYSPIMTNGIGTVKFDYHVTGESGDSVVYAIEYTTKTQSGDFGDGADYMTAGVYTNTIGRTEVYGTRSCNVATNYLYTLDGTEIIQMRCRIRILPEGTTPDAVLWLDNTYVNDFPEETDEMWKVYNGRLASADSGDNSRIYSRSGRTLYLNNSMSADTGEAHGVTNPYIKNKPYVQAPYLEDGIGEVAFHYRAYNSTNAANQASVLTIAMSNDKNAPEEDWTVITQQLVSTSGYIKFDDENIFEKNFHFIRFYSETNNAVRICIDNILVMEPSRPGYDISKVVLAPTQPLFSYTDKVGISATISRLTQKPTGIRLFVSWNEGTNTWGYSNWWTPELETAANTIELVETGTSHVYENKIGEGLPAYPANGTIQYVVWGKHDKVPKVYSAQDVVFENDSAFENPSWYGSVNLNDSITNSNAKATFSPYYLIYSCEPGSVWINEVWVNYNTSSKAKCKYPDDTPAYEFVELCGKANVDISGWTLKIYLKSSDEEKYSVDLKFSDGTTIPNKGDGWGYFVVGDEGTPNANYELSGCVAGYIDAFKATTVAFELLRDSGILECAAHIGSEDPGLENPNAAYSVWISSPKKSSNTSSFPYSYALLDSYTDEDNTVYTNNIAGSSSEPAVWYWALGYPTPGEVNRNRDNEVAQTFAAIEAEKFWIESVIDGNKNYGTQNGSTFDIIVNVDSGATTSIVYVAKNFYRIRSLVSNDQPVTAAEGRQSYTFTINSVSQDVINTVTFGPKDAAWSDDIIAWFNDHGWSENAILTGDGDDYTIAEEYLMDTDPTRYTQVGARTTAFSIVGDTAEMGMGLTRTNWTQRMAANGTPTEVITGLRGVVNVYGRATLDGVETRIEAAQRAAGAFEAGAEETTSFSLTEDAPGMRFFRWVIEEQ